jgi:putative transposase
MATYVELTDAGVTTRAAAVLTGVARATATRTIKGRGGADPATRVVVPANRLSLAERTRVLATLDSEEFVDQPPLQVYATLLARGEYLCSVSSMYRILAQAGQVSERRRLARHPARVVPELVATGPGQVYTWDIMKLPGPTKGLYYDAYVMIDIYSRYIVGAHVHAHEAGVLAEELMKEIFGVHGIPTVVHADRGTSMTSKTVATLLADLGVTRSHSRPSVSNDNPYSESLFKTMKYTPDFPDRFGSIGNARGFLGAFVAAYNHEHRHTGIGLHTPADVHYRHTTAVAAQRSAALDAARQAHPERFTTRNDPRILALPTDAWINRPAETSAA